MKITFLYISILFIFSSCSHKIVRTGYEASNAEYKDCNIIIRKNMNVSDSVQKVGEIKLGESGLSVKCNEVHAIELLKKEGCALNADIINIIEEKRPDVWSSCYRCRAEFFKYRSPEMKPDSNEYSYSPEVIHKRAAKDSSKSALITLGSVVLGLLIGFLLFQ